MKITMNGVLKPITEWDVMHGSVKLGQIRQLEGGRFAAFLTTETGEEVRVNRGFAATFWLTFEDAERATAELFHLEAQRRA